MSQDKPGQVVAFYSYKGGTGRSMAVTNVSCLLAKKGHKVLVIDWDLEAPTQHYPFADLVKTRFQGAADPASDFRMHPGLIDLLSGLDRFVLATAPCAGGDSEPSAAAIVQAIDLSPFIVQTDVPGLSLMKAGRFDQGFSNKVLTFDWERFYNRCPQLFTALARRLSREYDWVLIDTTSGQSDASNICTSIMPEKLVFVTSPSPLNLEGGAKALRVATEYRGNSGDQRPLVIFPLLSRAETREHDLHQRWTDTCRAQLEALFKDVYELSECTLVPYLYETEIPEMPWAAYSNKIAALTESTAYVSSLAAAYDRFVKHLTSGKLPWQP